MDRKEAGVTPLDEIKVHIKRYLDSKKKMDALKTLIETSKQSADIVYLNKEYNPENIQKELQELQKAKKPSSFIKQKDDVKEEKVSK